MTYQDEVTPGVKAAGSGALEAFEMERSVRGNPSRALSSRMSLHDQRGFTYLALLIAIALLGIGLSAASEVWVTTSRHHRMEELEWIGEQFVQGIGSYYEASPGSVKAYPARLEDLLEDRRYLTMRRHLRRIYLNPFTAKADWEPMQGPNGGVYGVRVLVPMGDATETKEFFHQAELK